MSVEEQVRGGRSRAAGRPAAPVRPAREARAGTGARLRPVVAAAVVLLLWLLWLALPTGYGEARSTGPGPSQPGQPGGPDDLLSVVAPGVRAAAGPDGAVGAAQAGPAAVGAVDRRTTPEPSVEPSVEPPVEPSSEAPEPSVEPSARAEPVTVPQRGDGTFAVAPGGTEPVGTGALVRYSVEVERGVPVDPEQVAAVVDGVLADPRSWTADGSWTLQRTDDDPDVRIRVTSPDTTDSLCAPLRTGGRLSCRNGDDVVLNALRWTQGAETWGSDLTGYRQYLVNHELGHYLGRGHVGCPGEGQAAPVMLQQTLGLRGCAPNAWPFP